MSKLLSDYMKEMETLFDEVAQTFAPNELHYFLQAVGQKKDLITWEYLVGQRNQTQPRGKEE